MTERDELQNASNEEDATATEKPGGLGQDGTIPPDEDGIAAGHDDEQPSHFEPEEDPGD